ncbi:hypothetical protein LO80_03075 [Candidatus Francisella endociliophora]|uniref:N-acetyltransferase domain-containing protein n=1 Tax=Candidatus Francisella endociliophora TaxID=653937 RepID=A0A097ENB5_9GAMM|nr:GNAT family protein [Francisella sp. FSC1006]AIT09056.1 hypothetical protein LO80_03075 [Francisella sp. FSC1006]
MISKCETIQLKLADQNDIRFILDIENDSENSLYIGKWTYSQHREALKNDDIIYFIIKDSLGNKVGFVIITELLNKHNSIHIKRIAISSLYKGKGYGKAAFELILNWIFKNTQAHRVWLDVKDFNTRAIHIYKSLGFVIEGMLRDYEFNSLKNKYESFHIMSILRKEYEILER